MTPFIHIWKEALILERPPCIPERCGFPRGLPCTTKLVAHLVLQPVKEIEMYFHDAFEIRTVFLSLSRVWS